MSDDFRDELDRLAKDVREEGGALDRVRSRANRNRRARRVSAGLVALAITSASVGLAIAAFRPGDRSRPAATTPSGNAQPRVWPYGTDERLDEIQHEVDEGRGTWRRDDREEVARAFAVDMLHWDAAEIVTSTGADPLAVVISNPSLAEAAGASSKIESTLFMEHWRGREDGILVITRAENELFEITSPSPGAPSPPDGKVNYTGVLSPVVKELRLTLALSSYSATSLSSSEPNEPSKDGTFERTGEFGGKQVRDMFFFLVTHSEPAEGDDGAILAVTALALAPPEAPPPPSEEKAGDPIPGPTPSTETPPSATLTIDVFNATGQELGPIVGYIHLFFRDTDAIEGVRFLGISEAGEVQPTSRILRASAHDDEAAQIEEGLLPGAEIGDLPSDSQTDIQIVLGQDFLEQQQDGLQAYELAHNFMRARQRGTGAERFLTAGTAGLYQEGEGGLSLYGYSPRSHEITAIHRSQDDPVVFAITVRIPQTGKTQFYETLHVGPADPNDRGAGLSIIYAERNE
jgi:hypothetical protein